ncbi:hypothetical protein ASZ90_009041 [hydrocarbon metagenome]|uniref:Uncharacterized protein n=1 Tax=hydrocarbon metagenome TaxID=938273 RepID=A0A0W8FJX8_9ZZZZ
MGTGEGETPSPSAPPPARMVGGSRARERIDLSGESFQFQKWFTF